MNLLADDSLTKDIIYNYHYLTFLESPELSEQLMKYMDYTEILKSAQKYTEQNEGNSKLKDNLFNIHRKLMLNSNCVLCSNT